MSARPSLPPPSQEDRAKQSVYANVGLTLVLGGVLATPAFYFVANSVPLTALALSAILLGMIAFLLDRSLPPVPPRVARMLLESGLTNLSGLLEETGVSAQAVYLPTTLTEGKARALIRLSPSDQRPTISRLSPQRFIVEFGPHPDDIGLLVSSPGGGALALLDGPIGSTSAELESALTRILVSTFDIADTVQVNQEDGLVTVRVRGLRLSTEDLWVHRILGSPVASVAAAVVAEGSQTPVVVDSEAGTKDSVTVRIALMR